MTTEFSTAALPLRVGDDGAVRIGESRVLLELVVRAFDDGATPEAIVQRYPTTDQGDIYATIGFYLQHRASVEQYLVQREAKADLVRENVEQSQGDLSEIRARLRAKQRA